MSETDFTPLFIVGGGIITIILGFKTLGNSYRTIADLLSLNGSFVKHFVKAVGFGTGTFFAGSLTANAINSKK